MEESRSLKSKPARLQGNDASFARRCPRFSASRPHVQTRAMVSKRRRLRTLRARRLTIGSSSRGPKSSIPSLADPERCPIRRAAYLS
jgi:hypothetical protein